jgi:hypothetical protein
MHSHHTVIHLSPVAIPLPPHAHRVVAALGDPRLVHHTDRLRVSVLFGHRLLATVVEVLFIPLDGFQETL